MIKPTLFICVLIRVWGKAGMFYVCMCVYMYKNVWCVCTCTLYACVCVCVVYTTSLIH